MTFIGYPNLQADSENELYRVEIVGREANDFFRDQSGFVYRCFRAGQPIWEWRPNREGPDSAGLCDSPHEVWVSDDGWVVVRTHSHFLAGLFVLSPLGTVALEAIHRQFCDDGEPGFLDAELEEYLGDSSAGPFWASCSIAYFSEMSGRPCWTIRTWWGRRVVIDLAAAKFIELQEADQDLAVQTEIALLTRYLPAGVERVKAEAAQLADDDRPQFWSLAGIVIARAYHAGWLQARPCIAALRDLESVEIVGSTGYGPVCWAALEVLLFRQVAKLSLLRMGEEPQWLSHYQFKLHTDDSRFEFPMQATSRGMESLQQGMSQHVVLRKIGAPDHIESDAWEYDYLNADREFTVRITWDDSHLQHLIDASNYEEYRLQALANPPTLCRIDVLEPQWKQITMRDHKVRH